LEAYTLKDNPRQAFKITGMDCGKRKLSRKHWFVRTPHRKIGCRRNLHHISFKTRVGNQSTIKRSFWYSKAVALLVRDPVDLRKRHLVTTGRFGKFGAEEGNAPLRTRVAKGSAASHSLPARTRKPSCQRFRT
jgi:hypothetical protein